MILPPELIEAILANLEYDAISLAACALASRQLAHARIMLFRAVRLASENAPSRLLRLLTDLPHLIQLIVRMEISAPAVCDVDLAALCILLCGQLDGFGRYRGAGPLRSVTLIHIDWYVNARSALLALLSCSSIISITLYDNKHFPATYLAYVSPNLHTLYLYHCIILLERLTHTGTSPPPISIPLRPAQITSLDLVGNILTNFDTKHASPFTFSNSLQTLRIFIESHFQWKNHLPLFRQSTEPSASLHTLSLVLAGYGKKCHYQYGRVAPLLDWPGFDLSKPPFLNLHTLNIYADTRDDALPMYCSLFYWMADTLGQLSQRNQQFESLVVHLKLCEDSKLINIGSFEDWDRLLMALNKIKSLARLAFIIKINLREHPQVDAVYRELTQLVRSRLMHRKATITIKKDHVIWPSDVYNTCV